MIECVDLDLKLIENHEQTKAWKSLTEYLKTQFRLSIDDRSKSPLPLCVTQKSINVLDHLTKCVIPILTEDMQEDVLLLTVELYRSLRNCCVHNAELQDKLVCVGGIMHNTNSILHYLIEISNKLGDDCVKMILQFLNNAIIQNTVNAEKVRNMFGTVIFKLFRNQRFPYQIAALIYNYVYLSRDKIKDFAEFYEYIIDKCVPETDEISNDYFVLLLELCTQELVFYDAYDKFKPRTKASVLTYLVDKIVTNKNNEFVLPPDAVLCLTNEFKEKSDCILKVVENYVDKIEPTEVALLLDILASVSAEDCYLKRIQHDKTLLINVTYLLRCIHDVGKQSQNNFTAVQKLSEVTSTNVIYNKEIVFGFKANLIRLLGSMCWKNKSNQDQLRELNAIPLLLDCCNIDARNPFIIQCTILTIRNLCENNTENQAVIAGINQQGVVDSSTLREMGLVLHDEGDNKIGIIPLDAIKK